MVLARRWSLTIHHGRHTFISQRHKKPQTSWLKARKRATLRSPMFVEETGFDHGFLKRFRWGGRGFLADL